MFSEHLKDIAVSLGNTLTERRMTLCTAESCTGGLAGAVLTAVAGSSRWFRGGVIAYANDVKQHILGVDAAVLQQHGAVSAQVVESMAAGACRLLQCTAGIAVSGIAGPDGGTPQKPVGTVWIGWHCQQKTTSRVFLFSGNRDAVRLQTVEQGLLGLMEMLK
ncbi:CinA family protein [Oleidesulfovibrio alaskensis]|jgi:nicotinamide-nucleotide amidase|uniref:CinA family protein n=1 Tax=Oleidesulfovibrio alaskensis TaxID=58180 RepID=UPI00040A8AD5|nr:CinA family protein [Oleidesulfovibrio alaskensis]